MHFRLFIAVSFFATLSSAAAQDTVLHVFESSQRDKQFENVLYLAAGVELTQAGLSSTRRSEASRVGADDLEPAALFEIEKGDEADYLLIAHYAKGRDRARIEFSLYGKQSDEPLARTEAEVSLDIDLDSQVASAANRLVEEAAIAGQPKGEAIVEGVMPIGAEPQPEHQLEPPTEEPPPEQTPPPSSASTSSATRGFGSTVMAGGLMVVGNATEYYRYGASSALSAGFLQGRERAYIGAGARVSVIRFFKDDHVSRGELVVTTGGAQIKVGTASPAVRRFIGRVSTGAAAVTVIDSDESRTKTVPYADAGIGAGIPLGERGLLGGEVSFLVVFEQGFPVMGVVPSVTFTLEP